MFHATCSVLTRPKALINLMDHQGRVMLRVSAKSCCGLVRYLRNAKE